MSLKHSYSVIAPVYDAIVAGATRPMRRNSLARLANCEGQRILLAGIGTGLDIPYLPQSANYVGMDLTPAMLLRARKRLKHNNILLHRGNVMAMPYQEEQFDIVVMHLILAVVPDPLSALQEASRVVRQGGQILILDKFLQPGQFAPMRRLMNVFLRHIATRTDVVFEPLAAQCPNLKIIEDQPIMTGGWFRQITLQKHTC